MTDTVPEELQAAVCEGFERLCAEFPDARPEILPLSDAQRIELRCRAADADAHPDEGIPWESVRDELFGRGG